MTYVFYGTKTFRIKKELDKFINSFDKINISHYDLENDQLIDIIDDCNTISLFNNKKLIICQNANIFTGSINKDTEILEEYLRHQNPNVTVIFTLNKEKLDSRKKITKLIKKEGKIIEFNNDIDVYNLVKENFKNYKINTQNINFLINRIGTNPLLLEQEIEKIKIYKNNDLNITKNDILNLTNKNIDTDIFKLIDYIVKNNKEKALETYYEMLKTNEEPIKIIIILANQFRIMYQSKELIKKGITEKDIASILKIHPYRVKLALQNSHNYNSKTLLKYLSKLADIDENIKSGKINKNLALELFILKK